MKKTALFIIGLFVLASMAGGTYWYTQNKPTSTDGTNPGWNRYEIQPVEFPLKGATLMVPDSQNLSVTLDLVWATARRDYPMGRFTGAGGTMNLYAMDDFTVVAGNRRAVPIVVTDNTLFDYYLAVLEVDGDEVRHITSLPIGDRVRMQGVTIEGNEVTVRYRVHDRDQEFLEVPRVDTMAKFDILNEQVTLVGRVPKSEEVTVIKTLRGEYLWRDTRMSSGEFITPVDPQKFTLLFDANRIRLGTDCNTGTASIEYATGTSTELKIGNVSKTSMFCESEQEEEYFAMIEQVQLYEEIQAGGYALTLADGAVMTFVPKTQSLQFENETSTNSSGTETDE